MQWYIRAFRRYAIFTGRAYRQEFWLFFLWSLVVSLLFSIIDRAAGLPLITSGPYEIGASQLAYTLVAACPTLAVTARRLHDTGRSGWWQLIGVIPIVGLLAMIFWLATPGITGENRYGADPRIGDPLRET